jgi:hypothetical protein
VHQQITLTNVLDVKLLVHILQSVSSRDTREQPPRLCFQCCCIIVTLQSFDDVSSIQCTMIFTHNDILDSS